MRVIIKGDIMDALIKYLDNVRKHLNDFLPEEADDVDKLLRDYLFIVCNYYERGYTEPAIEAKQKAFTRLRDRLNLAIDNLKARKFT
jgi:hypothetical protein